MSRPFFILATARSGSTSLAHILATARNGECAIEPAPNLNRESRLAMDGLLDDLPGVVSELVAPRVEEALRRRHVYGEKNVTYGPFIVELHRQLQARFVLQTRDGRDVVRSMIDWHNGKFGTIYREAPETGLLSAEATRAAARLSVYHDLSDFSRPRPGPEDPLYREWQGLSRAEMCAYYWSRTNALYRQRLSEVPAADWMHIDYTAPTSEDVLALAGFLQLDGLEPEKIAELLDKRINSLADRGSVAPEPYPHWTDWDSSARDAFDRLAETEMTELGYYASPRTRWRPADFGRFWREHDGGLEWYQWMYDGRRQVHEDLVQWARTLGPIESVVDLGCGLGVGYSESFGDLQFTGLDLSPRNVEWCLENRRREGHDYRCVDFIDEEPHRTFDLAFSQGTIDNVFDMDAFLRAVVRWSNRYLYVTAYRGWFPHLDEHVYTYNPEHGCFYNDLSPSRARRVLEDCGCRDIEIGPVSTGRTDIPVETRITARV